MFKNLLDEGVAGDNVGFALRGVDRKDIERGQVIAKPGSITPHTKFKAEAYVLTKKKAGGTRRSLRIPTAVLFQNTEVTGVANFRKGGDGNAGR
jgi:elongation factor Tu